jgi:uncharacterized protein YjbJ (UPF0337 family)
MRLQRIDPENIRGFADKFLGLGKELAGSIVDNDAWRKEGEAQQKKGTERLRALQDQFKAQAKEAKAETFERQQRAAQKMKESA